MNKPNKIDNRMTKNTQQFSNSKHKYPVGGCVINKPPNSQGIKLHNITQNEKQRKECLNDAPIVKKKAVKAEKTKPVDSKNLEEAVSLKIDSRYKKIQRKTQPQSIPVMISLTAEEIDDETERSGLDLVLVIDVSSSMSGEKIKLVKETLLFIIEELEPMDRVCLVKFNSQSSIIVGLTPLNAENKTYVKGLIEEHVNASLTTNINAGLRDAFDVLLARKEVNDLSSVFFLSDGDDTCGNSKKDIMDLLTHYDKQMALKNMDYKINSFGYGNDHDEDVLCAMSNFKSGHFFYIKNLKLVDECFIECLGNLISVFARNASIDLFLAGNLKFKERHGYSWRKSESDQKASIEVGSIYSGMEKDYMCDIDLPSIDKEVSTLKVLVATFNFNIQDSPIVRTLEFKLEVVDDENLGEANGKVEENVNRIEAAKLLEKVEQEVEKGNYNQAREDMASFKVSLSQAKNLDQKYVQKMNTILDEKNIEERKYTRQVRQMVEEQEYRPGFANIVEMKQKSKKMYAKKKA